MWVESIGLEGIKCFEKVSLRLGDASNKKPYPWITLLGENGTGKSTILQALGLLLAGPDGAKQLLTRPDGWLREENTKGIISTVVHQSRSDLNQWAGDSQPRTKFSYSFSITGNAPLEIRNKKYTEPAIIENGSKELTWLRQNAFHPKGKTWFAAGYGAFRRLTREHRILVPTLQAPLRYTNFYTQFSEDKSLEAFETWMVYLDYKISKSDDLIAKKQQEQGIAAINGLLPDSRFDSIDENGQIWFNVQGNKVPTVALSDGFRSILALAGDLIWRLIEAFPDSDNPLEEQGVVLIDELDIHLHPTWQRTIAPLLRLRFPNIQFVVTTHSPLVAAGAGEDAVTYRAIKKDGIVSFERVKDIYKKNVDDTLKSPAFGLVSTFSPQVDDKFRQYQELRRKNSRTEKEEQDYQLLLPFVGELLRGNITNDPSVESKIDEFVRSKFSTKA